MTQIQIQQNAISTEVIQNPFIHKFKSFNRTTVGRDPGTVEPAVTTTCIWRSPHSKECILQFPCYRTYT